MVNTCKYGDSFPAIPTETFFAVLLRRLCVFFLKTTRNENNLLSRAAGNQPVVHGLHSQICCLNIHEKPHGCISRLLYDVTKNHYLGEITPTPHFSVVTYWNSTRSYYGNQPWPWNEHKKDAEDVPCSNLIFQGASH